MEIGINLRQMSSVLIGDITISFATLLHQNLVEDWYPISNSKSNEASLLVHVQFKYSKIQLLRAEIAALRAQLEEKSMGAFVELDLSCETEMEEKTDYQRQKVTTLSPMRERKWWILLAEWLLPDKPKTKRIKTKKTKTLKGNDSKGLSTWLIPDDGEVTKTTKQSGRKFNEWSFAYTLYFNRFLLGSLTTQPNTLDGPKPPLTNSVNVKKYPN